MVALALRVNMELSHHAGESFNSQAFAIDIADLQSCLVGCRYILLSSKVAFSHDRKRAYPQIPQYNARWINR